jgi:chromosome segregation ATPase
VSKDSEPRNAARGRRPTKTEIVSLQTQLARDRDLSEKQISELKARLHSLEQELNGARLEAGVRIHSLEAELARTKEHSQEVEDDLARAKDVGKKLEAERDEARLGIAQSESRVRSLDEELDRLKDESGPLRLERDKARIRASQLEVDHRRLEEDLARAKEAEKRSEVERDEARQKLAHAEEERGRLQGQVDKACSLEEQLAALRTERDEAQRKIAQVQAQGDEARSLNEQLAALRRELDEARAKATQSDEAVVRSKESEQKAETEISDLRRELVAKAAQVEEADGLIQSLEEELARSNDFVKKAEVEATALRRELDETRGKSAQSEATGRSAEGRIRSLEGELKEAARRIAQFEDERAAVRTQVTEIRAAREQAEKRASALEARIRSLETDLSNVRTEASESSQTVERLRSETQRQESTRRVQEDRLAELRRSLSDLAGKLQSASASPGDAPAVAPSGEVPAAPLREDLPPAPGIDELFADPPPAEKAPEPEAAAPPPEPAVPVDPNALPAEVVEASSKPENLFGAPGENGEAPYVVLDLLFRDAMGAVHRAFDRVARRSFAVRFVPGQSEEAHTAAIEKEVRRLIGLPHPHLLQVGGSGRRKDQLYVSTDLSRAEPLGRTKIPEVSRISRIVRDCAEAVHYAHEEGIRHGDVNPENILVESREGADHALVKDFGLGALLESFTVGLTVRNPAYLPPEQAQDAKRTPSVPGDVYGLGATLYATLAGKPPFEGKDVRQVRSRVMMMEPPPIETVRADVPPGLAVIVRRAMAKEASVRYASAHEMAEALTRVLEGAGTRVRVNPNWTPPQKAGK